MANPHTQSSQQSHKGFCHDRSISQTIVQGRWCRCKHPNVGRPQVEATKLLSRFLPVGPIEVVERGAEKFKTLDCTLVDHFLAASLGRCLQKTEEGAADACCRSAAREVRISCGQLSYRLAGVVYSALRLVQTFSPPQPLTLCSTAFSHLVEYCDDYFHCPYYPCITLSIATHGNSGWESAVAQHRPSTFPRWIQSRGRWLYRRLQTLVVLHRAEELLNLQMYLPDLDRRFRKPAIRPGDAESRCRQLSHELLHFLESACGGEAREDNQRRLQDYLYPHLERIRRDPGLTGECTVPYDSSNPDAGEETLDRFSRWNRKLSHLFEDPEPSQDAQRERPSRPGWAVRRSAHTLHTVATELWRCSCRPDHDCMLFLATHRQFKENHSHVPFDLLFSTLDRQN